MKCTLIDIVDL